MKHLKLALSVFFLASITCQITQAQKKEVDDVQYRRSSLYTILMESQYFPMKDTVIDAYYKAPFPDKYNNHSVGDQSFNPLNYPLTNEERDAAGIRSVNEKKNGKGSERKADLPLIADKYLNEEKIANKMVAKWFNRQEDGSFNMDLIAERGFYSASEMDAQVAKSSVRGLSQLADAGEDLINNTFVIISRLNFVSNELAALAIRETAYAAAEEMGPYAEIAAKAAADIIYNNTHEGYSVWTTSRLYKLNWNDSVAAVFYQDYWVSPGAIDSARVAAFDTTSLFSMEFIGEQAAKSVVVISGNKSPEEIIKTATIRNIDKVYSQLQKEYDVFKTKTPLLSVDPLMAKVGMKEGLEGGEKFEVLEIREDPATKKRSYHRKGIISVDKKKIWDNRYNAGEENTKASELTATTFKGGKGYYPGMLIRQIK